MYICFYIWVKHCVTLNRVPSAAVFVSGAIESLALVCALHRVSKKMSCKR